MTEPATETFKARVSPEWLAILDAWRRSQPDLPSRAEAVRRLVASGLDPLAAALKEAKERSFLLIRIGDHESAWAMSAVVLAISHIRPEIQL